MHPSEVSRESVQILPTFEHLKRMPDFLSVRVNAKNGMTHGALAREHLNGCHTRIGQGGIRLT